MPGAPEGGGAWGAMARPVLGRLVYHIPTRRQIMPTTLLLVPQIFGPSDIPVMDWIRMKFKSLSQQDLSSK